MKGLVVKSTGKLYQVKTEQNQIIACTLKGIIRLEQRKSTNPIAVGDTIEYDAEHCITNIYPRKNYIIRKSINLSKQTHILASNLDQVLLIASLHSPKTSLGFIDRFLITAEAYQIPIQIIFNKKDLLSPEEEEMCQQIQKMYETIGYPCFIISTLNAQDINQIKNELTNKITLIAGHSGVGKSTLINAIEPTLNLKTNVISNTHLKGMHTTTFVELHALSFGGSIIDSPGIQELGLVKIAKEELKNYFKEFKTISNQCKFNNCMHINEPHCGVIKAVSINQISKIRYQSYLGILNGDETNWNEWELK